MLTLKLSINGEMLVRCLESTSPAETLVDKGVLEDLVRFGVCVLFHILSVHRDAETQSILCDIRVTHCSESEKNSRYYHNYLTTPFTKAFYKILCSFCL